MSARVYIGLGSNVGPSRATLAAAVAGLARLAPLAGVSSLWRTAPRDRTDQPAFLNAVVALADPADPPETLLAALQALERAAGRVDRGRYGPRELDLDLLLRSGMAAVISRPTLAIPHPRLHERAFALAPLAELAPAEPVPPTGRTVGALLGTVADQEIEKVAGAGWWTGE